MTNSRISAVVIACAIAGTVAIGRGQTPPDQAQANGLDPFFDHGARGELIHVLPTPAGAAEHGSQGPFSFAPPSNGTAVYAASYGTGNLINHGGPVIQNAQFKAIFWNQELAQEAAASVVSNEPLQQFIEAFITRYGGGAAWNNQPTDDFSIVQQYGTLQNIASTLPLQSTYIDNQTQVPTTFTDAQIQSYLTDLFAEQKIQPDESVIYGVYFPAGMTIQLNGTSCTTFCGYHSYFDFNGYRIKYAAFPYLNCSACRLSNLSVADMLTIVTSHEVREAVTDQQLNAWFDKRGYEADDKCAWHNLYQVTNGDFWVQPEYSNGGTSSASGITKTYPGPGCVVPNQGTTGSGGGGGGTGHGHSH